MDRYAVGASEGEQLPNRLGLTDKDAINSEEAVGFLRAERAAIDALSTDTLFSLQYLYALHREALGALYDFAGRLRTVNMSKNGFMFVAAGFLPETLATLEHEYLEPLSTREWDNESLLLDHLAAMHAELLYVHPFREGNGRVARLFAKLIFLAKTGNELNFELITKGNNFDRYIGAVQHAANSNYAPMQQLFREMCP
jgi:cell filamentation protein